MGAAAVFGVDGCDVNTPRSQASWEITIMACTREDYQRGSPRLGSPNEMASSKGRRSIQVESGEGGLALVRLLC